MRNRDDMPPPCAAPRTAGAGPRAAPGPLRRTAAIGGALAAACLLAAPAAWPQAFESYDFNEEALLPPGFALALEVTSAERDALLQQAIGVGHAEPAAAGGTDAGRAALVAVRLTAGAGGEAGAAGQP